MSPSGVYERTPMETRFWAKVDKGGPVPPLRPDLGPCWLWTASTMGHGYGKLSVDGRHVGAHRVAYELLVGPIPAGLELDHLCFVERCVNPAHLEAVTHEVNNLRRQAVTAAYCKRGHLYTAETVRVRPGRTDRDCILCARETRALRTS